MTASRPIPPDPHVSIAPVPLPIDPLDRHLGDFRRELEDASFRSDAEIAALLTTGYALVLELEADYEAAGRHVDEALMQGDDEAVIVAVRRQRGARAAAAALREELEALSAIRRLRRGAQEPPLGP